jgi:hypothetical protein
MSSLVSTKNISCCCRKRSNKTWEGSSAQDATKLMQDDAQDSVRIAERTLFRIAQQRVPDAQAGEAVAIGIVRAGKRRVALG